MKAAVACALAAAALAAVAVAAAQEPSPPPDPPQLVAPAAELGLVPGRAITFRIRASGANPREAIELRISRSPTQDETGRIGKDVLTAIAGATSTQEAFELTAKPDPYHDDWLDRPGTYYWQANRYYGWTDDNWVESEVRAFRLETPARPASGAAVARLEGGFRIVEKVTASKGFADLRRGRTLRWTWILTPACSTGPCTASLEGKTRDHQWEMHLSRTGAVYRGTARHAMSICGFGPLVGTRISDRLTVQLRITDFAWIDGNWRATRLAGTLTDSAPAAAYQNVHCPAATYAASFAGTLAR